MQLRVSGAVHRVPLHRAELGGPGGARGVGAPARTAPAFRRGRHGAAAAAAGRRRDPVDRERGDDLRGAAEPHAGGHGGELEGGGAHLRGLADVAARRQGGPGVCLLGPRAPGDQTGGLGAGARAAPAPHEVRGAQEDLVAPLQQRLPLGHPVPDLLQPLQLGLGGGPRPLRPAVRPAGERAGRGAVRRAPGQRAELVVLQNVWGGHFPRSRPSNRRPRKTTLPPIRQRSRRLKGL